MFTRIADIEKLCKVSGSQTLSEVTCPWLIKISIAFDNVPVC